MLKTSLSLFLSLLSLSRSFSPHKIQILKNDDRKDQKTVIKKLNPRFLPHPRHPFAKMKKTSGFSLTREILSKTMIGKTVNKIGGSHQDPGVRDHCRQTVEKWKKQMQKEVAAEKSKRWRNRCRRKEGSSCGEK
jgi:hypothetical protein